MSKNIKTLICCILALVFVAGTIVAVFADSNSPVAEAESETASDEVVIPEDPTVEEPTDVEEPTTVEEPTSETPEEPTSQDEPKKTYLLGDVNLDGKISAADARLALRYGAKLEPTLTSVQVTLADVNGDGMNFAEDARMILRVSARLEPMFGTVEL